MPQLTQQRFDELTARYQNLMDYTDINQQIIDHANNVLRENLDRLNPGQRYVYDSIISPTSKNIINNFYCTNIYSIYIE